eukprot:200536-Hanusia_phi.AAC.1
MEGKRKEEEEVDKDTRSKVGRGRSEEVEGKQFLSSLGESSMAMMREQVRERCSSMIAEVEEQTRRVVQLLEVSAESLQCLQQLKAEKREKLYESLARAREEGRRKAEEMKETLKGDLAGCKALYAQLSQR